MKTIDRSYTTVIYYWIKMFLIALAILIIFPIAITVAAPSLNKNKSPINPIVKNPPGLFLTQPQSKLGKPNNAQLIPSQAANIAVNAAFDQLGKPYLYGSSGPSAFDCSGLVLYSYQQAGVFLPHNAAKQQEACTPVEFEDLLPGDLIFSINAQHVGMYIGNNKYIHSPETGEVVRIDTLIIGKKFFRACRPLVPSGKAIFNPTPVTTEKDGD